MWVVQLLTCAAFIHFYPSFFPLATGSAQVKKKKKVNYETIDAMFRSRVNFWMIHN